MRRRFYLGKAGGGKVEREKNARQISLLLLLLLLLLYSLRTNPLCAALLEKSARGRVMCVCVWVGNAIYTKRG